MRSQIPEVLAPYNLLEPAADAAGRASTYRSLKGVVKAWLIAYINQGNAATVALTVNQATTVAGGSAKVITACRIWTKLDEALLVFLRQTDAANFTTDAALKKKIVIFEIDPTQCMDVANDFDCINLVTGASNAANITSALLFVQHAYEGVAPINILVD